MRRRKIALLCVAGFLLVAAFMPRMEDDYSSVYEQGKETFYKSHVTHIGILHILINSILDRSDAGWKIPYIKETQLLKDPDELTHDERIDILSDECNKLFIHGLNGCRATTGVDLCSLYYDWNQYFYCKAMYDETPLNRQECKMFHDIHLEFWEGILRFGPKFYILNDFEEVYCRG